MSYARSDDTSDLTVAERESEQLISSKPRVEAGYPTGHVASGSERVKSGDGGVKNRDGTTVSIGTKMALEFISSMFLFFFGTLGAVNSSAVAVSIATTLVGSTTPGNASIEYTTADHHTVIANPLSTFLTAPSWSGVLFMCLRSFPGVSLKSVNKNSR